MPRTKPLLLLGLLAAIAAAALVAGLENDDLVFDHDSKVPTTDTPEEHGESLLRSIWKWLNFDTDIFSLSQFRSSGKLDKLIDSNSLVNTDSRRKREVKEDNEISSDDSYARKKSQFKEDESIHLKLSQKYRQGDDEDDLGSGEPEGERELEGSANVDFQTTQPTTVSQTSPATESNPRFYKTNELDENNVYRISMTIKEPYREEFRKRNGENFQKFAENLTKTVEDILHQKLRQEHRVSVVKMDNAPDPFESHVDLDIRTMSNENDVRDALKNHLDTYYSLGKFTVNPATFRLRVVLECQPGEIACDVSRCILQTQRCDFKPDCEDGSDEVDCRYPPCAPDEFICNNGQCIRGSLYCDGKPDCYDRSDESNCLTTCSSNEYRCLEGVCISIEKRCNGQADCRKGDDEESCDCRPDDFYCEDGNCVSYSSLCNGVQDCKDGSDEKDCEVAPCPSEDFTCGDGSCISKTLVCDGIDHCLGAEDELYCEKNCTPTQFKCVNGNKCIERIYRCDGHPDCPDRSDEDCQNGFTNGSIIYDTTTPTKCGPGAKPCENGVCISKDFFCDGNNDCLDNSDEKNCNNYYDNQVNHSACRHDEFECSPQFCINRLHVCNGRSDCPDGRDERNCTSPNRHREEESRLNLKIYPSEQIIKEKSEVVFQCRDEGPLRAKIRWTRGNGRPLPPGSQIENGRLEIPNIKLEHSGTYVCETELYSHLPGHQVSAQLTVEKAEEYWYTSPKFCKQDEATCNNEECIPKSFVCDGKSDCSDGSDEFRCGHHGCEPNEFRCGNKQCIFKAWRCDGDKDCTDGTDEQNCAPPPYNSPCNYGEFKCADNQCIPKTYQCDHERDCLDGSDELGCSPVYIIKPPPPMVVLDPGDTLSLTCTAIGVPTPEVNWRLNWGHIPQKCETTSTNGTGTLDCPDIRIEDQGAYSCEGINVMGFIIAVPDTILVVKHTDVCPVGKFNSEAKRPEDCISCFCFGAATECQSANLFTYQVPLPIDRYKVVPVEIRPEIKILGETNFTETVPVDTDGVHIQGYNNELNKNNIVYFGLPEHFHGNQLKSYGGYLHYDIRYTGNGINNDAPTVIISGNNLILSHNGPTVLPNQLSRQKARFIYGEWYKNDPRGPSLASREDIMMVLGNINNILIKAEYENSPHLNISITNVMLDSAGHAGSELAPFVEKCQCPSGYAGLSCEECAPGYTRRKSGRYLGDCYKDTVPTDCPRTFYGNPSRGIPCKRCSCPNPSTNGDITCRLHSDNVSPICDCPPGYEGDRCERCADGYVGNPWKGEICRASEQCDRSGSISQEVDPLTGRCRCKEHVTGPKCNQCKANTFSLASANQFGCIGCFCMGVTNTCVESNWFRSEIQVSFTNSARGFALIGSNNRDAAPIISGINLKPETREIVFNDFPDRGAGDVYYWHLPTIFLGNQITAYGGNLKYIVRYVPSPGGLTSKNSAADVELISSNDITLLYYSREVPEPNNPKTFVVPLLEQYWQRSDGTKADREHLLMALADVEAIRIKATYTTHTYEAALSFASLDVAKESDTGRQRANEVEKCSCPPGYQGLSCEDCAPGYTRAIEGLYLGICEPCKCNGHSEQCDSETGTCENCLDHTTGENCEICVPGYEGDPTRGTPYDCQVTNGSYPLPCHCNPAGSQSTICTDDQCYCKRNVEGKECDRCRPSTFGLSHSNPDGCNECFCSGVSNQCHESSLYIQQIPTFMYDNQHGFTLTDAARQLVINDNFELNVAVNEIGYRYSGRQNERLFWSLPNKFIGNQIKSYGGNLSLTQHVMAQANSICQKDQDVILIGNGITLYWVNPDNITPDSALIYSVPLKESAWRHLSSSGLRVATRSDLMQVLANLDAILVRASYCNDMIATYISDITLDTAVETVTGNPRATQIEVCRCPAGYTGSSCETCAPGYYRNKNDRSVSVLGSCTLCPCNGHEQSCELDWTGHVRCNCHQQYTGTYCQDTASGDNTESPVTALPTTISPSPIVVRIREPKIQIVKIGESVRYHCTARSLYNEPVTVKWEKEGGYLPPGRGVDDSAGLLVIREVQVSDSGDYICRVTDGTYVRTEKVTLHVGDSRPEPVITISPPYLKVTEGDPAEFRCEATGSPESWVEWNRPDGRMNPNATFGGGILRIPSVTLDDAAEYKCSVRSSTGIIEKSVLLHVKAINPTQPDILLLISPTKWSGFSGDTVRLICNASKPVQKISWSRTDRLLLPSAANQSNGILTIANPSLSDAGWYVCTAILHDGSEKRVTTSVAINPRHDMPIVSIEPKRQKVPQGQTATITCRADGDESNIKWIKNRESNLGANVQAIGNTLRITNIQVSNRGIYTCKFAHSEHGNYEASAIVEVEPREMPILQIYPKEPQVVLEGSTADFHCRAIAGIPPPTIKWTRQDNRPLTSNIQVIQSGMLRINNVSNADAGSYVCIAENPVGVTSATANLEVHSFPTISVTPQNGVLRLKLGDKLHLICNGFGLPQPVVSWSKDYLEQPVIDPYSSAAFGPSATIDINSVSKDDEGTYTCKASNAEGIAEDYVQIRVEDDVNSVDYPDKDCRGDTSCFDSAENRPEENPSGLLVDRIPNVPVGGKVSMRCRLEFHNSADKNILLNWKREDGRPIPRDSQVSEGILYLNNIQKEDSGDYICYGIDLYGKQVFSAKTSLTVLDFPKVELRPARQTVRPGENPSIYCIASGEQPLNVEWEAVGRSLPPSVTQSNGVLQFNGITFSDAGKYVCKVWNHLGTADSVAEVSVEAAAGPIVRVQASKNPVNVGETVELHCATSGIINPRYVWSRLYEIELPNNARQSGNILTITDVNPLNAGTYRCAINSDQGTAESDINLRVTDDESSSTEYPFETSLETKYVPYGKTVELSCRDHLQPPGRYRWSKSNGSLPRHEQHDNILRLIEVDGDAAGVYSCKGNNGQESKETYTTVVVTGLVPYFSQAPLSFIELQPLMDAYVSFEIEISFRPENYNGILLYTSESSRGPSDFVSLALENAFPVFKFDLGSGPTAVKADKPISLHDWHTISIRRHKKEGIMVVDEVDTYTATSKGKKDGLDVSLPLYVGGVAENIVINENVGENTGFVGCINRLLINNKQINLVNNIVMSQSITNCEICEHLENPCSNGVCQESTAKDGYECLCNVGYTGSRCQTPKQSCLPDICGDGECIETDDGYECQCPRGRTGPHCEYSQMVRAAKLHHPRAYLGFSTPKSVRRLKMSLSFRSANQDNAILMYCAQNNRGTGDFIALIIYNRHLRFLFDIGAGVYELGSNYTIDSEKWYHVNISKDYKVASLSVNAETPIKKSFQDSAHSMNLKTLAYFGGVDRKQIQISKKVKVKLSFYGCMDKIKIYSPKSELFKSWIQSSHIEECRASHANNNAKTYLTTHSTADVTTRKDFCLTKPCIHGLCQNVNYNEYSCTCEYGYVGKNCENILKQCELLSPCINGGTCTDLRGSYKCDCPYGFMGQNCSKSVDIGDDAIFRGDGWLELSNSVMTHEDEREMIGFEISTNETNGLIMWHSDNSSKQITNNYVALAVIDGYIEFQYNLGSGPAVLKITTLKVDDGRRHRIILKRNGRDGSIELDGEHIEIGTSDGVNEKLEINGNVFIGGVPEYSMTQGKYSTGFSGCIHTLEVQDSGAINLGKHAVRGKNVSPCTRARWIPSSLVFTDGGEDIFDAFIPPPPVNIIHPKPTVNIASISFRTSTMNVIFTQLSMKSVLQNKFLLFFIVICIL